ncbi:hypothetical protein BDN71DRAFT_1509386 [Pleurotus eryngii]|uniref:Uncharacterized protein n=1 Tax=Pleurotus eryngii TaxID=5323 RepID=A0A9P5ZQ93_PLEER|nr:hypothetical protein BDN71DRAFT_1509386 [Pleurotus eryngii]
MFPAYFRNALLKRSTYQVTNQTRTRRKNEKHGSSRVTEPATRSRTRGSGARTRAEVHGQGLRSPLAPTSRHQDKRTSPSQSNEALAPTSTLINGVSYIQKMFPDPPRKPDARNQANINVDCDSEHRSSRPSQSSLAQLVWANRESQEPADHSILYDEGPRLGLMLSSTSSTLRGANIALDDEMIEQLDSDNDDDENAILTQTVRYYVYPLPPINMDTFICASIAVASAALLPHRTAFFSSSNPRTEGIPTVHTKPGIEPHERQSGSPMLDRQDSSESEDQQPPPSDVSEFNEHSPPPFDSPNAEEKSPPLVDSEFAPPPAELPPLPDQLSPRPAHSSGSDDKPPLFPAELPPLPNGSESDEQSPPVVDSEFTPAADDSSTLQAMIPHGKCNVPSIPGSPKRNPDDAKALEWVKF